ncbi:hypothetical protein DPEC_G00022160 [Dallia pectoralis]|uniref:Uncharacterized protein n=1 Tax=Dallia pectoralis TaxID=75939 RepID=A0ACC2HHF4_DALPE|nr:hypothetical protein DPEC_G00022160 [Dallia pectoralis]
MDREESQSLPVCHVYSEGPPSHLAVSLLGASGLRAKTFRGGSNPYAVLRLGSRRLATSVVYNTLTPRWDCELTFPLPTGHQDRTMATVILTVYHRRSVLAIQDKFLGSLWLRLEDIYKQDGKKEWFVLRSEPRNKPKKRGQVELSFQFYSEPNPLSTLPQNLPPLTQTHSKPCTLPQNLQPLTQTHSEPCTLPKNLQPLTQTHSEPCTLPQNLPPNHRSSSLSCTHRSQSHRPSSPRSPIHSQPPSICSKSCFARDRDTPCSSSSVEPVVTHWEPIQPFCGEENAGLLDCIPPPSAPAGPQEPAASPDCVSVNASGENGDLKKEIEDRLCLLKNEEGPSSAPDPLEEPPSEGSPTDSHTSCNGRMFLFQQSQQGRLQLSLFRFSFRSRLRRLRYRLDSGERGTLRLPAFSAVTFRSSMPVYDRFPEIEVSKKPQGFFAQHFPCLGSRQ